MTRQNCFHFIKRTNFGRESYQERLISLVIFHMLTMICHKLHNLVIIYEIGAKPQKNIFGNCDTFRQLNQHGFANLNKPDTSYHTLHTRNYLLCE